MPDWVVASAAVGAVLALLFGIAWRNTSKQIARTLVRRPNPTREAFMEGMTPEVSKEAALFLWETALPYLEPRLTLHPDDDLVRDLPIDDNDWSMDWPREFAEKHGFSDRLYPDWPHGRPVTVKAFGMWLDLGRQAATI